MNQFLFSRLFSILISVGLLISPLPITAIAQEIALSEPERAMVIENPKDDYIYLGSELSNIAPIVEKVARLDHDKNSLLHALKKHIDNGFFLARYDAVVQALQHAALVIERNCTKADNAEHYNLMNDFELLMNQVSSGSLHVDTEALQTAQNGLEISRAPNLPLLVVNRNVEIVGKTTLITHLNTKQGIHCQGHLKVNKSAKFKKGVRIEGFLSAGDAFIGNLSVGDLAVAGCMDFLCVENFSAVDASISGTLLANDAFINNATINNLSITASVLDSVINNLTVNATASINDAIITNATITSLSSTDANIQNLSAIDASVQNLTVANCMTNLCVNSLSVVDMAISGTLTINDIIIDDATILDFSAVDASITGSLEITPFTTAGVVHNDALGLLSTSLIVNADVDPAAAIVDTKLATISTAGKVANSATTGTSANTPNTLVLRDGSGDFAAGIITADLNGNATTATTATTTVNFSGSLAGDVTGTQGATVVSFVGGETAANVAAGSILANAATDLNTASTIVRRDASGDFAAGIITADLNGNATTATTTVNFSGSLAGDVTGTQGATVVSFVGGETAANVAAGSILANAATDLNTASTIVRRDASGNFAAGTITANLTGTATNATTAVNFSGSLAGDVTGTQGATVVSLVGGETAANVAAGSILANAATNLNTASTIVRRDASGNFAASAISMTDSIVTGTSTITPFTTAGVVHNDASGLLSSSLIVNADVDPAAAIVDTKLATISTAGKVANSATTATTANTPNTIVLRDVSGNFITNEITIQGAVTNPTDAATKAYVDAAVTSGLVSHDPVVVVEDVNNIALTGLTTIDGVLLTNGDRVLLNAQTNPVENGLWIASAGAWTRPADFNTGNLVGQAYVLVMSGTVYAGSSWLANTPTAVIDTDPISFALFSLPNTTTGANVGAGTGLIFRDKTGNNINFKTLIAGTDIIITNNTDDITIATNATSANTANTIVQRDASGNFSAGTITANLTGNATNFTGSLVGDVTGTQGATVVSFVGGQTAANVAAATVLANTGTNLNTPNTLVRRDATGSFAAQVISMTDGVHTGNLVFTGGTSTSTTGNITKGGNRFIHNFGTSNTFVGVNSGNFTLTGNQNSGFGVNTLTAITTGINNLAAGVVALNATTTGSNNVGLGAGALQVNTTGVNNTAVGFQALTSNISGASNTAVGYQTLISVTNGSGNIALGNTAGGVLTTGSGNIYIDADAAAAAESTTTRIGTSQTQCFVAGINGVTPGGATNPVIINSSGQLGTTIATSSNIANTIVARDASGDVSLTDSILSGNLVFTGATSTSTTGNIIKGGNRFIHNFGTSNTFVGVNSGNFTVTGNQNSGFGVNTLTALTSGSNNLAAGILAMNATTTGSNNVGLGAGALQDNTTGGNNTAVGFQALTNNTTGSENVALGYRTLASNVTGTQATAVGTNALQNYTGNSSTAVGYNSMTNSTTTAFNTAVGWSTLATNTTGANNVAIGYNAMNANTIGDQNTAVGVEALATNTVGAANTAIGSRSLELNTTGQANTAVGQNTLFVNTTGANNVAIGAHALESNTIGTLNVASGFNSLRAVTTGTQNTSYGCNSLENLTTGSSNTALGAFAGQNCSGSSAGNIYINNLGTAESNTTRIGTSQTRFFAAGIRGVTTANANAISVLIDSAGQLGTASSSRRYKHDIQDMNNVSANILNLRPVTFAYNTDESNTQQFGLIAEEVAETFPAIVVNNEEGQPETVQYHVLPVLLLNEVKKQQALINAQQEAMKEQENAIEALVITVTAMNNAINELQSQVKSFMSRSHNA